MTAAFYTYVWGSNPDLGVPLTGSPQFEFYGAATPLGSRRIDLRRLA